jgi:uncharacterized membrane protein YfcA
VPISGIYAMSGPEGLVAEFGVWTLVAVAVAALITSSIHGAVGVAGGFLMTAALSLLIGVRPVVPVMSVALTISHLSRSLLNLHAVERSVLLAIIGTAVPMIVVGALLYGVLPVRVIATVLAIVILSSIPVRRWARSREIKASKRTLSVAGVAYGFLAGASIGSQMLLAPFMLGYGLTKEAFVATMAVIAFSTNITRIAVFGGTQLLDAHYLVMGILVGLVMIPGNWIGRNFLRRMAPGTHSWLIDLFAAIGGLNFLYLAVTG